MKIAYIILFIVLILAALALIACAVTGVLIANMVILPKRKTAEQIRQKDTSCGCDDCFDDYEHEWERHDFTLEVSNATISGEYVVNPNDTGKRKRLAIICHGHTVFRFASLKYAKIFYDLGYNLILFDERYFGRSLSQYCTLGMNESQDIKQIIAYGRTIFGSDCFIGLHGESMGAASELLALDTEKPDFVVADCPFADTRKLMLYLTRQKAGIFAPQVLGFTRARCMRCCDYDMKKVNPINSVRRSEVPICFVHGLDDDYIPCEHSKMMYRISNNPDCELHLYPGAQHARALLSDRARYEKMVAEFVNKIEKKAY